MAEGAKMIIALQGVAGIEEPEERAKAGWNLMTDAEKETTRRAYNMFFGKEETWWCCGVERPVSQSCSCGERSDS